MAMALAVGGHESDAFAHVREAIRLRPNNPLPAGNIARLLSRAIGQSLPPPRKGAVRETTLEAAELFALLSEQYVKVSRPQSRLDADAVARDLALAGRRQRRAR